MATPVNTVKIIDVVVSDLGAAIEFYRRLGLEFVRDQYMPDDHAGCDLPNGLHLMLDTDEARRKITAHWTPPTSGRAFLTFEYGTRLDVRRARRGRGGEPAGAVRRAVGNALRDRRGSFRQRRRSVRHTGLKEVSG
ncbi:MAG TPA: VOC family protein [Kribbella sp.]